MEYEINSKLSIDRDKDEISNLLEMLNDSIFNNPVASTADYFNQRLHFFQETAFDVNTHQSVKEITKTTATANRTNNADDPKHVDFGILNSAIIDFDFLQFYGDKIDQSLEMIAAVPSKTSDATIPHSMNIDHPSIVANEVEQLLGTLGAAGGENIPMDWNIDEDSMQFLESIVDETEMSQDSTMDVAPLDEKGLKNTKPAGFTPNQNKICASDEKHAVKLLLHCDVCNKVLASRSDLQNHIDLHAKEIHFECNLCSIQLLQLSDLFEHTKEVHGKSQSHASRSCAPPKQRARNQGKHRCSICLKYYSSQTALRIHINAIHTKEISYNCSLCPKVYYYHQGLQKHIKRFHADHNTSVIQSNEHRFNE